MFTVGRVWSRNPVPSPPAGACIVDASIRHQQIDGFGISQYQPIAYAAGYSSVADALWSPSAGIGISIYNAGIMADSNGNGQPLYQTTAFNGTAVVGDFSQELAAYNRGVRRFCIRCWTAQPDPGPYTWQTGGSGTGSLLATEYSAFANMFTTFLTNAWNAGIPWTDVSPLNEPDFTPSTYGQISWTTAQMLTMVKNNLGPALVTWGQNNPAWQDATGLDKPRLMVGETLNWASDLGSWITAFEGDATALGYIDRYTTHQYGSQLAAPTPNPCSRPIEMTECSDQTGGGWDATMTQAMREIGSLYRGMANTGGNTGNAQSWWHWWTELMGATDNQALIGTTAAASVANWNAPTYPKRFYAFGNFSKFVRPFSTRIDVSNPPAGVNILAFRVPPSSGQSVAIVCINTNGSSTGVTFFVNNIECTQVTPWITDASNNLVQQSPIQLSQQAFSTTLGATSVTTFVC